MNIVQTPPVEIALRNLGEEDRRRVGAWIDHLKNWEGDRFVREHSRKLPSSENVYALKISDDFWIFFRLEADRIVLLDLASDDTIKLFDPRSRNGQ